MELELYDATLREGEQAAGAHFDLESRIELFKRLDEFGFDYIELGWPIVSEQVFESFEKCRKVRKNAKIVAFGSTSKYAEVEKDENLNSLIKTKADYACIFGKTIKEHISKQLKISPEENLKRIGDSIRFLKENNMPVFYDAEHFFDGFKEDENYALETLVAAAEAGAERLVLCDTKGGVLPSEAKEILAKVSNFLRQRNINTGLGVHYHNDSGLALANTLVSLDYVSQIQGTINGIGERIGNLNFSEFLPVCVNKMNGKINMDLTKLKSLNEFAYKAAGLEVPFVRAFVGDSAFAHKGGAHIDALNKDASYEHETPEDFGNKRIVLFNSLGGKGGVVAVAKEFGYELDKNDSVVKDKVEKIFEELRNMERQGYNIGAVKAEQYLLIEKYFGNLKDFIKINSWEVRTSACNGLEKSEFVVEANLDGQNTIEELSVEGGPVNAAYKTIRNMLSKSYPQITNLKLDDFHVSIARASGEESVVRTMIVFKDGETFETIGVDKNILQSSIEAIEKGFRYYLNKIYKDK